MMTWFIDASTPSTLGVWRGVISVVNKAISLPHTTTPLCIGWCGVVCGRGRNWVWLTLGTEGEL